MTDENVVEMKAVKTAGSMVCMTVGSMVRLWAECLGERSAVAMVDGSDVKMACMRAVATAADLAEM